MYKDDDDRYDRIFLEEDNYRLKPFSRKTKRSYHHCQSYRYLTYVRLRWKTLTGFGSITMLRRPQKKKNISYSNPLFNYGSRRQNISNIFYTSGHLSCPVSERAAPGLQRAEGGEPGLPPQLCHQ
jgi:hypothetical protein